MRVVLKNKSQKDTKEKLWKYKFKFHFKLFQSIFGRNYKICAIILDSIPRSLSYNLFTSKPHSETWEQAKIGSTDKAVTMTSIKDKLIRNRKPIDTRHQTGSDEYNKGTIR